MNLLKPGFLVSTKLCSRLTASFTSSSSALKLVEVGPRDGLQNEKAIIATEVKVELVNRLTEAGLTHIEVSSFVSPKWVPQLADATQVFQKLRRRPQTRYIALVPNASGMKRALAAGVDEVAIFAAASETFSKKNINCSIMESIERFKEVLKLAKANNVPVRGYVSCVVSCPYEGAVSADAVASVVERLWKDGCYEISLGDTIGMGTPESIDQLLQVVLRTGGCCPPSALAIHCHDTNGRALENVTVAVDSHGISVIDASIGGLGGCPYAGPGAHGNVATERVVEHLLKQGHHFTSDLKPQALSQIGQWIREKVGLRTPKTAMT